jgi:transposase-like protein
MTTLEEVARQPLGRRLARMERTADDLAAVLRGISEAMLSRPPDEKNWAAKEIVCHLRDVEETYPLLYLHGLSSGDFREALPALLGPTAAGLSSSAILRLTKSWTAEYEACRRRDLADRDYVYLWADGVHFTIRREKERLCTLVVIGVRPDGTKEVVALEDGYRESAESWRTLLRDRQRRGVRAPVLAIGDGALGFWAAVRDVWPETAEPQCWVHRIANVLDKLPRSLQPRAKQALHEIMYAETRAAAAHEIARFTQAYGAKYPKAVASLTVDQDRLLAYFDYPADHWKHLRTPNPIESTFATVRLRAGVTKGAGSRTAGLVMAFKLLQVAEGHCRRIDALELVPLVLDNRSLHRRHFTEVPQRVPGAVRGPL